MTNPEKWMELCALAARETDSEKLLALVQEINRLLTDKDGKVKIDIPSIPSTNSDQGQV